MTPDEVALVLTKASAVDQRTIGEADVLAWHEILERVELADAIEAVKRHYAASRERIMPADVLKLSRTVRDERSRATAAPLALPGRFEDDAERDARVKAGAAKVRKVIAPLIARMSVDRDKPMWQKTGPARGAWWEDEDARERHATELLAEMGRLHVDAESGEAS